MADETEYARLQDELAQKERAAAERRQRIDEDRRQWERARLEREAAEDKEAEDDRETADALKRKLARFDFKQGKAVYLRFLDEEFVQKLVDEWVEQLRERHANRYKDAVNVLGGVDEVRRLVEDVVLSLSRNKVGGGGRVTITFNLLVNGDPQRGKSNIEAVIALVVFFIHSSKKVKDQCYTLLGSVMIGWAQALFTNAKDLIERFRDEVNDPEGVAGQPAQAQAAGDGAHTDEEDEGIPDDVDVEAEAQEAENFAADTLPFESELVLGSKADKERWLQVARAGGMLVFPRNKNALVNINELVEAAGQSALGSNAEPPVHFVILDEADQMRGTTARHSGENAKGRQLYQYEKQLRQLFGFERAIGNPGEPLLCPSLVVDVSATNQLSFLSLLMHLRDAAVREELAAETESAADAASAASIRAQRKLLDIIAFEEEPDRYTGLNKCVKYKNIVMGDGQLKPSRNHFVDNDVVDFYKDIITTANACGLIVTTNRVYAEGTNMDEHFKAASTLAMNEIQNSNASTPESILGTLHAGVIVHGGESRYKGCMGIYLQGAGREIIIANLNSELRRLGKPIIKTGDRLNESGAKIAELCADDLRPLLEDLDRSSKDASANALAAYHERADPNERQPKPYNMQLALTPDEVAKQIKPKRLSYVHLPLLLTLIRKLRPGVPIIVVGHAMVRRCLSIVGVNYLSSQKPGVGDTTCVVTHMLLWATKAANGAGVVQQAGRCCHTLPDFRDKKGNERFRNVQLLAPQLVWDFLRGGLGFNVWLGRVTPGQNPANARDKVVRNVEEAVTQWVKEGKSSVAFAVAVAEHLDMPSDVRRYLSYRGAVPAHAALPMKSFRDEMQEYLERASNFGYIYVRRNAAPEQLETECRLLLRTSPWDEAAGESETNWLLGELLFRSKHERDEAQLSGARAAADAVNAYLARKADRDLEKGALIEFQERCKDAFRTAKSQAVKADGTFDAEAVDTLAQTLAESLMDNAPEDMT